VVQELQEESCGCGTTSNHSTSNLVGGSIANKLGSSDTTSVCSSDAISVSSATGIFTGRGGRDSPGWPRHGDGVVAVWPLSEETTGGRCRICTTIVVRFVSDRNEVRAEGSMNKVAKFCSLN